MMLNYFLLTYFTLMERGHWHLLPTSRRTCSLSVSRCPYWQFACLVFLGETGCVC